MKYEDYVRNFKGRIIDLVEVYIKCHTEIDDDDGILIDYRTHQILLIKQSEIKGKRGDFYPIGNLVDELDVGCCICLNIIDDIVSMYVSLKDRKNY